MCATADLPAITHVWSSFGHTFMSTDSEDQHSCLTCGAMFRLVRRDDDPTGGDYMAANGDDPMPCTGDTSAVHGYAGEVDGDPLEGCNCLSCT